MQRSMHVLKRDGKKEAVSFDKVLRRIQEAAKGLEVQPDSIAQQVLSQIFDGVKTCDLDELAAQLSASLSTLHPDYGVLAARLTVSNHHKRTPYTFRDAMVCLSHQTTKHTNETIRYISEELESVAIEHADLIESKIDYQRDYEFDYFGFKTLEKSYLLKDTTGRIIERPQHMWMRVALSLWLTDLDMAFSVYELMSQKVYTHATPTLFNAGTPRPQLSSCFLMSMADDSIAGIYKSLADCAAISKYAGGIGLHCHNIRARGSLIKGTNGQSNGLVPMLRVFNNTARYVDQCFVADTPIVINKKNEYNRYIYKRISDIEPGEEVMTSGSLEYVDESGKHCIIGVDPSHRILEANMSPVANTVPVANKVLKLVEHSYDGVICKLAITIGKPGYTYNWTTTVTPKHPVMTVITLDARKIDGYQISDLLKRKLAVLDYIEVADLKEGDWIAYPSICSDPTFDIGLKYHYEGFTFTQVSSVVFDTFRGKLYDLEVEGTHDYTVAHLGIVHNGGGKRNGSFAVYLEPWHADIDDFLRMKLNTGAEEERARDLFYALWIPDLFMRRVEEDGDWTLFCPNEAPGLSDVWGEAFDELYTRYEREGRGRKTVSAQKLWFKVLDSQMETGTPYILYKDAANRKSNQQNLGTIKSSNLCVAPETYILTDKGQVQIHTLENKDVNVWNGSKWSPTIVRKTGTTQKLLCVRLSNGSEIYCTPYHKFILSDGYTDKSSIKDARRIDASELKEGMKLIDYVLPDISRQSAEFIHFSVSNSPTVSIPNTVSRVSITVVSVTDTGRIDDTYCFNEPENHAGVFNGVLTGNCTEIIEYSSPDETAVCNLASIALPHFVNVGTYDVGTYDVGTYDFDALRKVTKMAVKSLNRVIDVNFYPTPETRKSNFRHRPIGLGVQGLADVFALMRLPWESPEALRLNQLIFEHMYYAALEASSEIALTEGSYETYEGSPASKGILQPDLWSVVPITETDGTLDWPALRLKVMKGIRNSLLLAPMPTASTSQILGYTECFEPMTSNIYARRTLAGEYVVVNRYLLKDLLERGLWSNTLKQKIIENNGSIQSIPEISAELKAIYKTGWEIKQRTLIDMAAGRGPFICQSQSLNLFIESPNYAKLTSMHFYSWKQGLKTGCYYLRTKAPVMAQKFTVDPRTVDPRTVDPRMVDPRMVNAESDSEDDAEERKLKDRAVLKERLAREYVESQTANEGCLMCSS